MVTCPPEEEEGAGELEATLNVTLHLHPGEHGPHGVELPLPGGEPRAVLLVHRHAPPPSRRLCLREVPCEQSLVGSGNLTVRREALHPKLADDLQHRVARLARWVLNLSNQALVHQRCDEVEDGGGVAALRGWQPRCGFRGCRSLRSLRG